MVYRLARGSGLQDSVLRWSNQHRATKDGATYLWAFQGRPAAIMAPYWAWDSKSYSHEFQSLHSAPFNVELDSEAMWTPKQAGLKFQPDPQGRDVSSDRGERLDQMKRIAASFTAIGGTVESPRWGLPLKSDPIFRYEDQVEAPGVVDGAMSRPRL